MKGGLAGLTDQHVTIAGHKIPLALLGVVATIGAAILLMRNAANNNAAATEAAQASGTGVFGGASGTDVSGSLQNLQTQLQAFASGLNSLASPAPSAPSDPGVVMPSSVSSGPQLAVQTGLAGALSQASQLGHQAGLSQPASQQPTPSTPAAPYVPPVSTAIIPVPVTQPGRILGRTRTPDVHSVDYLATPYVSSPALNAGNPISDYGRGN